ncbi:MAG: dephospho-CoA kinase [Myxococcota bacterium]|nr:dephospho-CoA kinase [Myxococcota bacterium]
MSIRTIGLTGGIASGKSAVSERLLSLGATILCADTVYHQLISPSNNGPSPLAQEVADAFPGVLRADGAIDRTVLGARVFGNPEQLQILGSITAPAIATESGRQIQALEEKGVSLVIYDMPLLFERKLEGTMEGVIVVWVPRAVQLERLQARNNLSASEAERRIASQLPLDDKRQRGTWIIDNSGSLEDTHAQVDSLWSQLAP